ncbi:MAG TPA: hypothetical protein VFV95_11390 [Vicinamibacterales bacterium]|nr:hypothetical protein [Vicinamibacterales bacterium]
MADVPDVPDIPRPSQLWKQLTPERKQAAAEAFWTDESASMEQTEAVLTIAQRIKFRVSSVLKMPRDKKARHLVGLPALSEPIAARLLVAYHLGQQRPMMASFLDGLGVKHEEGLIADEELAPPSTEALQAAVRGLATSYPAEDVALYLSTLIWQDPDTWGALAELPESKLPARVS